MHLQAQKALDDRAASLQEAEARFAREKEQMLAQGTSDNDVLDLNISGTLLSIKRSTLTQACADSIYSLQLQSCH